MATLAEVARHAGVAVSTVSYVLSGKRAISADTRRRVLTACGSWDTTPTPEPGRWPASAPTSSRWCCPVGVGKHVPVLMQFATSVVTAARQYDHDVLLLTADEGSDGLRRAAASALVDGLVLMDAELHDSRVPLLRTSASSVLIGFPADSAGLTCVDLDFARAGELCVEHLAERGHPEIALLGAPSVVYDRGTGFAERTLRGVIDEAAARASRSCTGRARSSHAAAAATVTRILADRPGTTGLIVQNEAIISPLLSVLRAAGRVVPEAVSVVAHLPRPGGGTDLTAPDVGGDPGAGHGPPGGGTAGPAAGWRRGQRGGPAPAPAHRARQHRPACAAWRSRTGHDEGPHDLGGPLVRCGAARLAGRVVVAPAAADRLHH